MRINWAPILSPTLIGLAGLCLFIVLGWGLVILRQRRVSVRWISLLGGLRVLIILLFLCALLRPSVSWQRTTKTGPAVLVLMDASPSMMTPDSPQGKTRLVEAVDWMEESGLAGKLDKTGRVQWFRFNQHAYQSEWDKLGDAGNSTQASRYADALASAFEQYRYSTGETGPVRVLLVGDGNDRGQRDVVEIAQSLGVTVDTLAPLTVETTGSGGGRARIVSLQSPRRVLRGSESRLLVTLRQQGLANQPLNLKLKQDGQVIASRELQFGPEESEQQVSLIYHPQKIGFQEYEVELAGVSGEAPTRKVTVEVVGERYEVLLLEDSWRWEFKFLRRVLEDDPSFNFTGFLSRGGAYVEYATADRLSPLAAFPRTAADLNGFNVIILGDVDPRRWAPGLAGAIRDRVVNNGASLIVLAGPRIGLLSGVPELGSLLPVEFAANTVDPLSGPVRVEVNPSVLQSPFFFHAGPNVWANLPPMDRIYPPLHKKPAATILLEAPELRNDYGQIIVAAEQAAGKGRVLYLGTDTLWKWQTIAAELQPGVTPYLLFWQQALRAMAPNRLAGGGNPLALKPEKTTYEVGEKIVLAAQVDAIAMEEEEGRTQLRGTVKFPDEREVPLSFIPDTNTPHGYLSDLVASQPGSYLFNVEWVLDGKVAAGMQVAVDVEEPADDDDAPVDEAALKRIAAGTGGRFLSRNDPSTWPLPENLEKITGTRNAIVSLWDNATLLILLVLLMGTDWAIRLKNGFV